MPASRWPQGSPTRPPGKRSAARRWALIALAAGIGVACAGPELPDAPQDPHIDHTATLAPLAPGQTPDPSQSLPPAPHNGGQLVSTQGGYLEFLSHPENGLPLYFVFPYDGQLAPLQTATSNAAATLIIDGAAQVMTASIDSSDGSLFFYVYPHLSGSSHQIQASCTISGTTYTGSFTDP